MLWCHTSSALKYKSSREKDTHTHTHTHTHAAACFTNTTPQHTSPALNVSTSSLFSLSAHFISTQQSLCPHSLFLSISLYPLSLSLMCWTTETVLVRVTAPDLSNGCFLSCFVSYSCSFANFQSLLCCESLCKRLSPWLSLKFKVFSECIITVLTCYFSCILTSFMLRLLVLL